MNSPWSHAKIWIVIKLGLYLILERKIVLNTHLHVTAWVLALILLLVSLSLHKSGKRRGAKITHMILRLDYIIIILSGLDLLRHYFSGSMLPEAIIKSIAGLWIVFAMEMILVRNGKNHSTKGAWIQLIIAFIIALALGFGRLPLGFLP